MYQSHEFYLRRAIEISKEARESVQGTRKRHLQQEHLMNIPESFCGIVHYIRLQSHVRCVQELFTGRISEELYTE